MTWSGNLDRWEPSQEQRAALGEVARAFGLEPAAMVSRGRRKAVTRARQAGYWVLRRRFRLSWPQIGKLFGGRDHSTVIYGAQSAEVRRETCAEFRRVTDALAQPCPRASGPVFANDHSGADDAEREQAERRKRQRIDRENAAVRRLQTRAVRPVNSFVHDDDDAIARMHASDALSAAIAREGLVLS